MELKWNFFLSVAFILNVSAKPLAGKGLCNVVQNYPCGKERCPCLLEATQQSSWLKLLKAMIQSPFLTCYCEKRCTKVSEVQCEKGTCDNKAKRCNCFPCWTGPTCSQYVNRNQPRFTSDLTKLDLSSNQTVGYTMAVDDDASQCQRGVECRCAKLLYTLLDGGDGTFSVDETTGEIRLESPPFKDDYLLEIGVSNEKEMVSSKTFMHINTRNYHGRKILIPHFRARRSVSSGTLILTIKPIITTVYYYNIGDKITFTISLAHNSSVTAVPASNININVSSEFLKFGLVDVVTAKSGSFSTSKAMAADILQLSLYSASFESGNTYTANVTGTVKSTIGPLSNLKLTAELNATSDIHIKATSSPVVYAVYPKVNLTQSSQGVLQTYESRNFSMVIQFPKLNYSLLVELTTNIQDFIFMIIQDVKVKNIGSNIQYNDTAQPKYYSTNNDGKNDRVVINFGYLQNNADTQNSLEIAFSVKILDHPLLANNTQHWVGVGLQAGLRVLWVEQQVLTIMKTEPTLELEITATNFTNITRLYFGNSLPVSYTIKHTNTSTQTASDVKLSCAFENLVIPDSEISANRVERVNSTLLNVKPNSLVTNSLSLGNTLTGLFNLQLPQNVTPFTATKVKCFVSFKNAQGISKDVVSKQLSPDILVGTPSIILTVNGSNTQMSPGETRQYTVKVLLTKLRSPIRFELVVPVIANQSVFHISSVEQAVIGSNVKGLNASAKPQLISSQNNGINNFAIYDLGIGLNVNESSNPIDDTISIKFNVILLDHNNVTNGSSHWVGAGLVGKPYMIWVGQISMTAIVPVDSRPWLQLMPSIIEIAGSSGQYPDYKYSFTLNHKSVSNQQAYDTKIRFFLPAYVVFSAMVSSSNSRLTQKRFGGSRLFEIKYPLNFPDSFNITFQVQINSMHFPHEGKVFITTPIYLLYKNRLGQHFTSVKQLSKSVVVPEKLTIPTVAGVSEHYDKGISWHVDAATNTYTIYICSNDKAKRMLSACYLSTDRGTSWRAMDSRVSSILGRNNDGNLVGIGKNKRAYMMYDNTVSSWISVTKSKITGASTFTKLGNSHSSGNPGTHSTIGQDHWGVSKDGVFMKVGGAGSWIQKSVWL